MNGLLELSERLKLYRINYPMTQKELSDRSGLSVRSISRFENGEDISLSALYKILRALELDNRLDMLVPDLSKRPSAYLESEKKRQRASKKKKSNKESFVWGDEK
ncbi:MAG: helix-turn-helix transcriptional regulator [Eubacterium sp.]|nr:helix-turn-helix transcriptional regulator [Butyrivibrio sp.]MBP3718665.1 helix-turn-helix transcriptional regulator [Eubacterium sp.]MBR1772431.1 helix-turn-helix transcriptional regulator [Eubacterium sp.]